MRNLETVTSTYEYVIAVGQLYILTNDNNIYLVQCIDEASHFSSFDDCEQMAKDVSGQVIEIKTTISTFRKFDSEDI